jgi:hypothetical protein
VEVTNLKEIVTNLQTISDDTADENEQLYSWVDDLQAENKKLKKSVTIGIITFGVSEAVGTPLIVEGIKNNNQVMTTFGVCIDVIPTGIYSLGHYVFNWW